MKGPFDNLFDLNQDGKMDPFERYLEYQAMTDGFTDSDEDVNDDDEDEDTGWGNSFDSSSSEDDEILLESDEEEEEEEDEDVDWDFDDDDEEEYEPHSDEELKQFSDDCQRILEKMIVKGDECVVFLEKIENIAAELEEKADTLRGELSERQLDDGPGDEIYNDSIIAMKVKDALKEAKSDMQSRLQYCRKELTSYIRMRGNGLD